MVVLRPAGVLRLPLPPAAPQIHVGRVPHRDPFALQQPSLLCPAGGKPPGVVYHPVAGIFSVKLRPAENLPHQPRVFLPTDQPGDLPVSCSPALRDLCYDREDFMAVMLKVSKDTMCKYIRELETAGYLIRKQVSDGSGRFCGAQYIITDTPGNFGDVEPCPKNSDTAAVPAANKHPCTYTKPISLF